MEMGRETYILADVEDVVLMVTSNQSFAATAWL